MARYWPEGVGFLWDRPVQSAAKAQSLLQIRCLGRSALWPAVVALLVQCLFGSTVAMRMWVEATDPLRIAQEHCAGHPAEQGAPGNRDQKSGRSTHDHEHCLLCNATVGACPAPVFSLLSTPPDVSIGLASAPRTAAFRKAVYDNAPRGPPRLV